MYLISIKMQKNILSLTQDIFFIDRLDTFTKREHKTKCYKECSNDKNYCFCRSCLSLCNFWCYNRFYYWSNSSWECIWYALIVDFSRSFSSCDINNVWNDRILYYSNEITILTICFFESISCTEVSLKKFYFLSCTEYILEFCWSWLSRSPDNVARVFPYFWFISWACCPFCDSKCNHIWIFLFTLIGNHEWCSIIRPIIK